MSDRQSPSASSLGVVIGVGAVVVLGVFLLLARPAHQGSAPPIVPHPAKPTVRGPLRLSQQMRRPPVRFGPRRFGRVQNQTIDRSASRSGVGAAPARYTPPAARDMRSAPAANQGGTPAETIDPEDVAEDIPALTKVALDDADPERRLEAVVLLSMLDDPQVIPVLAQALSDQDEEVRMTALESLSDFTDGVPVDAIESAMDDSSPDIRYEALSILADLGGARARRAMQRALSDPDEDVRSLAESALELDDAGQ
ncbi:MAG: HEAT repeat domain-containing protein [Candidatus Binatia bacterium]